MKESGGQSLGGLSPHKQHTVLRWGASTTHTSYRIHTTLHIHTQGRYCVCMRAMLYEVCACYVFCIVCVDVYTHTPSSTTYNIEYIVCANTHTHRQHTNTLLHIHASPPYTHTHRPPTHRCHTHTTPTSFRHPHNAPIHTATQVTQTMYSSHITRYTD